LQFAKLKTRQEISICINCKHLNKDEERKFKPSLSSDLLDSQTQEKHVVLAFAQVEISMALSASVYHIKPQQPKEPHLSAYTVCSLELPHRT